MKINIKKKFSIHLQLFVLYNNYYCYILYVYYMYVAYIIIKTHL